MNKLIQTIENSTPRLNSLQKANHMDVCVHVCVCGGGGGGGGRSKEGAGDENLAFDLYWPYENTI